MKKSLGAAIALAMEDMRGLAQAQETLTFPPPDTAWLAREMPELLRVSGVLAGSPDSAGAHLALGQALESAGDLEGPMASYRRSLELDRASGEAGRYLRWAEQRKAAGARRVAVPAKALAGYAGSYRERTVVLRGGRLHYGGGADPESPLLPMSADLFELERDPAVRVRFVGNGAGPAAGLVAIYRDGSVDRWSRAR